MYRKAFYLLKVALAAFVPEPDAPFPHLVEGEHYPRQQVYRLADEDEIAGEGIPRRIVAFPGAGRFKDKRVRGKRLTSEDRAIVGDGGFKAFGVDALPRKPTLVVAFPLIADARDFSQQVSEPAAEDVAFVSGHLQRFLNGVSEAVAGEAEVREHGGVGRLLLL